MSTPGYRPSPSQDVGAGREDIRETSVGDLIADVSRDLSTLVRQELELAKTEVKAELGKTGRAVGMLSSAGFAGYMTVLFLSLAVWAGLNDVMPAGWAAVIVALIWAVAATLLAVRGRRTLRTVRPKPERTVETVQQIPDALTTSR